jgi:hypothetical protein
LKSKPKPERRKKRKKKRNQFLVLNDRRAFKEKKALPRPLGKKKEGEEESENKKKTDLPISNCPTNSRLKI